MTSNNPTPSNDELFQLTHSFAIGDQCMECEEELNKELLNWANKKVIEGRIDELKHIQSEYGGRFNAVTYITGDDQTIEARYNDLLGALRKKGDL